MNDFLTPLGDRSHHFTTEQVMEAIGGNSTDYVYRNLEQRLHFMTSGERYMLYRAVKKLVLAGESTAEQRGKEEGLRLAAEIAARHYDARKNPILKLTRRGKDDMEACARQASLIQADINSLLPAAQPEKGGKW